MKAKSGPPEASSMERCPQPSAPNLDRITNLAPELIEQIFLRLPLKDAVRTSALSRIWRARWRSAVRQLDFGEWLDWEEARFQGAVTGVLDAVTGPIDSFKLWTNHPDKNIPGWMVLALALGVTAFDVSTNNYSEEFKIVLPKLFFICRGLTRLFLEGFKVRFPPGFEGFKGLTALELRNCEVFPEGVLDGVVARSSSLTELHIINVKGCTNLEVSSVSLCSFSVSSYSGMERFTMKSCPNLKRACISIQKCSPIDLLHASSGALVLPKLFFTYRGLTRLYLRGIKVRFPPGFEGFKGLTALELLYCEVFPEGVLDGVVARSSSLTERRIIDVKGCRNLEVSSVSLCSFSVSSSCMERFAMKNCPNLKRACIGAFYYDWCIADLLHGPCSNLRELRLGSPSDHHLRGLRLGSPSYHHLPPKRLPHELSQLRKLHVDIDLSSKKEVEVLLCILRSAPALQCLHASSNDFFDFPISDTAVFWENGELQGLILKELSSVELVISHGKNFEMAALDILIVRMAGSGD